MHHASKPCHLNSTQLAHTEVQSQQPTCRVAVTRPSNGVLTNRKACSNCLALVQRPPAVLGCAMGTVQVLANFGSSSFKCDVSSLESDALQCVQDQVQQTQAALPVKVTTAHDNTCCLTMASLVLCLGEMSFSISQTAVLDKISIHHKPTNVGSRPRSCKQLKSPASLPVMSSV